MKFTPGDIFEVYKNDDKKFFFRYLTDDEECLMGNVIQIFDFETYKDESVDIDELLRSPVKFNAHVYIQRGIAEELFKKIDNVPLPQKFEMPWFKHYETIDFIPEAKTGWTVWEVNGREKYLGKVELPKKYENISFGAIRPPKSIIKWYEEGNDNFKIPVN